MPLPPDFQFSQASLQAYVDCPRRFELRYILELAWPAVSAEPADEFEAQLAEGEAFHRLVHQHLLGLPAARLVPPEAEVIGQQDEDPGRSVETSRRDVSTERLGGWWQNYLSAGLSGLPPNRYPELTLSAPAGGQTKTPATGRLLAKYDLVAIEPGQRAVIVDWKTSQRRPGRPWLAARLQTRVYRYVLARAAAHLNRGQPVRPEQVEMIYWFAEFPDQPERLAYDATQYAADEKYLSGLIAQIATDVEDLDRSRNGAGHGKAGDFLLTNDLRRCRFCPYRSLCDRGAEAGDMEQDDDETVAVEEAATAWGESFDFEQVGEIAF